MSRIFGILLLSFIIVGGIVVSRLWQQAPATIQLSQELKEMRIRKELSAIERAKQQDVINYQITMKKLENREQVEMSQGVQFARKVGAMVLLLWPVWILLGVLLLIYTQ